MGASWGRRRSAGCGRRAGRGVLLFQFSSLGLRFFFSSFILFFLVSFCCNIHLFFVSEDGDGRGDGERVVVVVCVLFFILPSFPFFVYESCSALLRYAYCL
ncbi:hypothetical protein BZA05DRAFT_91897 [Tricharina praecox]|uniref:uncharacterized protein n=1 Tax=Tricharina praecox TaxID=43433 RepID=UPI00221F2F9E|nr:uncharacterized protein BZA05DRAFT_91897 [Tricharina praecox]KAI5848217.1 hypothetical protein BZA05DRAFT_91897 [Tricharina praecox]